MKTNKSFAKRLRVTKNGKIVSRAKGQSHYNAKEKNSTKNSKGRSALVVMSPHDRARFLPGGN